MRDSSISSKTTLLFLWGKISLALLRCIGSLSQLRFRIVLFGVKHGLDREGRKENSEFHRTEV
jgi:hypothetical protein